MCLINLILTGIAKTYRFIWYKVFQRREPWTPQFCRLEHAYPYIYWFIFTAITLYLGAELRNASFWLAFRNILFALFLVWFHPHILRYRIDHPENEPNWVKWANKRLSEQSK